MLGKWVIKANFQSLSDRPKNFVDVVEHTISALMETTENEIKQQGSAARAFLELGDMFSLEHTNDHA